MSAFFFKRIICIVLITISAPSLGGCTFARQSIAILKSTDHFIPHKNDPRVLFEPGAEAYANKIARFLPSAVQQVEEKQYRSFTKPVRVYVCASRASFIQMYGADVRAGVLTKFFLSPRVFEHGDDVARRYLIHELSHLHIRDQIGNYKMNRLPFWFKEGLATYVSDGGGAHTVTEIQAIDAIKSGRYFVPNETGGFIIQNTPSDWGLKHHMFYRQSMMFMSYLATINHTGYRNLLLAMENGERFAPALQRAYDKELVPLWNAFLHNINTG
ncbi:MAG: hypothetical protein JEZ12_25835 [Desulfobacterium sp.]|nr:hypothetical protein [Desulfobacterium sp.]